MMDRVKKLTLPQWIIVFALIAGTFLRFYNFRNTLQFLGDQGRDVMVAKKIFKEHDLVFIGPVTSTGNMYLGPLYYYFMVPFLMLTYPDPLGPSYAVAVISIATIFLIYHLGKEMVGERAAVFASVFFAFSRTAVYFARFSWNPNPAPFVSMVLLWAVYRAVTKNVWYWALVSLCISILIQLHYVALLTIGAAGIFWLLTLWKLLKAQPEKKKKNEVKIGDLKNFALATVTAFAIFFVFLTPQILFDYKHQWLNANSLRNFVADSQDPLQTATPLEKIWTTVKETHGRSLHILFEMFLGKHRKTNTALVLVVVGFFIYLLRKVPKPSHSVAHQILFTFFVVSVAGLSFYRGSVFDHYIAFLFPVAFLMFGVLLDWLMEQAWGILPVGAFMIAFLGWNFMHMPLKTIGWTIDEIKHTSDTILERVKPGEKYNIVLLSATGDIDGQNYRYFLEVSDKPPVPIERRGEVETLFIINEDQVIEKVVDSPIYEIVVFPNKNAAEVYTIQDGPKITVLRKQLQ